MAVVSAIHRRVRPMTSCIGRDLVNMKMQGHNRLAFKVVKGIRTRRPIPERIWAGGITPYIDLFSVKTYG